MLIQFSLIYFNLILGLIMFCLNCGNKINLKSLCCDKCGYKINENLIASKKSNKFVLPNEITRYAIFGAVLVVLATVSFWLISSFKWVRVPVVGDENQEFYYERKWIFPQNYLQNIKILINMNKRSNLNELSYVLDININCLTDRSSINKVESYFKKDGRGDLLHVTNGFRYFGAGLNSVKDAVCKEGLKKISSQPSQLLKYEELNIHLGSFLQCKTDFKLREKLLKYVNPSEKNDRYWVYNATGFAVDNFGNYAKLPVKQILFGVCDKSGELGCGWSMYTALILDMPKDKVRKNLLTHRRQNIDFTIEYRDTESQLPFRPHLADFGKSNSESILSCDSGNL